MDFWTWFILFIYTPMGWVFIGIAVILIVALFLKYGNLFNNIFGFVYCAIVVLLGLGGIITLIYAFIELYKEGDIVEFIKGIFGSGVCIFACYEMVKFALHCFGYI